MPGTILLMDNRKDVLDKWGGLLEGSGYHVLKAPTLEEAENVLRHKWVHLAILDIRMEDEDDENDISGLLLAQRPEFVAIPKIVLTAYKSYKYVRMVLAPDAEGKTRGVNFIAKDEGPQALRRAIEHAFDNNVRINWDLEIQWGRRERLSFPHLVSLVQPDLPNDTLVQRADELEDLIRRLFYDYQQLWIGRLLWSADKRFCLPVLASSSVRTTDSRILVCGERERVERERVQTEKLTPEAFPGTKLVDTTETMHFGVTAYVLPNANIETVQTLRDLFRGGGARPIKATFDHLLGDVLTAWHQHGQIVEETHDLMSLYRQWVGLEENDLSRTGVERRIEALVQEVRPFISPVEVERGDGLVTFRFPNQSPMTFPDPVATVYAPLSGHDAPVVCRISPGRLTADNVLVDAKQRTWLTDFARAGQAPQWWDFVCLEAAVRFDLGYTPELSAWHEFEKCLVTPGRLHARLQTAEVVAGLRTSVAVIEQVRRQAGSEAGPNPVPYYAGLLAWAVRNMACYDPDGLYAHADRMRGAHLLLAAAMIADRLGKTTAGSSPEGELRLDKNGSVWIGDHRVADLVGQEFALLRCLYDQGGQPISYPTIVESVLGEPHRAGDKQQESRIRSLVRRLRVKVEPNPDRPRYILTVRRRGYRLGVAAEPDR